MKNIKTFTFILIILFILLFSKCELPGNKNFNIRDSIVFIDSVRIVDSVKFIDSLNVIDSISITDSISIKDSVNIIDSLVIIDSINYKNKPVKIVEVFPSSVITDSVYAGSVNLTPGNMLDNVPYINRNNKGTRWAVEGYPHSAIFRFAGIVQIDSIAINTFGWNEGYTHTFNVYNYADTILSASTSPILYSGHRIIFFGSQIHFEFISGKNSWTDIGEIKFYEIF